MTAKSVLMRPQGLRPEAHAPTPLLRHCPLCFGIIIECSI